MQPPPAALQNRAPETSRMQQLYPATLPPRPSWVPHANFLSHSTHITPKVEPIPPVIVAIPLKDTRSPRARERTTSGIEEGTHETQTIPMKRDHGLEMGRENGEDAVHKRRRLENNLSHSEGLLRPYKPSNRTNDKGSSASAAELKDQPDEGREATIQSLQKTVSDLEKSLHKEKSEVRSLKQELDKETRKRVHAELIVEGIRREMNDPFIVPTLLDAFIAIADISDRCMEDLT